MNNLYTVLGKFGDRGWSLYEGSPKKNCFRQNCFQQKFQQKGRIAERVIEFRKLGLKKRMVKVLVWSVVSYGSETWTLRQEDIRSLEVR